MDEDGLGLSSENRNFIVGLIFFVLAIFGPSVPFGVIGRIAFLITVPTIVWILLRFWGGRWEIDALDNERIFRAMLGGIGGALLVGAYLSLTSDFHEVCDQYIRTRDGRECVGDWVTVKGGDEAMAFLLAVLAIAAFKVAIDRGSD